MSLLAALHYPSIQRNTIPSTTNLVLNTTEPQLTVIALCGADADADAVRWLPLPSLPSSVVNDERLDLLLLLLHSDANFESGAGTLELCGGSAMDRSRLEDVLRRCVGTQEGPGGEHSVKDGRFRCLKDQ